jgi:tight adherence protein C
MLAFLGILLLMMGGIVLLVQATRMDRSALARREELVRPQRGAAIAAGRIARRLPADVGLVGPRAHGLSTPEQREVIRQLWGVGLPARQALGIFTALRAMAAGGIGGLALAAMAHSAVFAGSGLTMLVAAVAGLAGWLLPIALVRFRVRQRAAAVTAGLPEALELLVICVEGGLALEDAVDRIVVELARSQPALADELAITAADLKILPSRDEAFANLAGRVDSPSVRSVVTVFSQTMRYGTPLAQAIRLVAAEMRSDSLLHLEERANRLPVILTVPMMIFIMPTIFLIVGGPTALKLIDLLWQQH